MNEERELLKTVDPWFWVTDTPIYLQTGPYQVKDYEWQREILQTEAPKKAIRKGAQMGATEMEVLSSLHSLIFGRYPLGALYLFPSANEVGVFSKSRFNPLIENNPTAIGQFVKNTDSVNLKQIGKGFLYLRGARMTEKVNEIKKDAPQLRYIPVDKIVFDEVDLISPEAKEMALERMSASRIQEESYISTPTIPDWGIDRLWHQSDQRLWLIRCERCNKDTCLEMEFPKCIVGGKRVCVHCGSELTVSKGRWVPSYSGRDICGWWPSQLMSPFVDAKKILDLWENPPHGNRQEVANSKLGLPWIDSKNRLAPHQIVCSQDPAEHSFSRSTVAGVDVGKTLHAVVGYRESKNYYKIIRATKLTNWNELHDLIRRYNTKWLVVDAYPELHLARDFLDSEENLTEGWRCQYNEQVRIPHFDSQERLVRINRTELHDKVQDFIQKGYFLFPRKDSEMAECIKHLTNFARIWNREKECYFWKKLGPDHFRHALGYFLLAADRSPILGTITKRKRRVEFKNWSNKYARKNQRRSYFVRDYVGHC